MKNFKYQLSYPDSKKLLDEALKKDNAINDLMYKHMAFETKELATKAVNKLLYETAENMCMSLYDLCFHTVPEWGAPEIGTKEYEEMMEKMTFRQTLKLVPVEFDLTHDGGYWKEKYFALKEKMQELIDSKEIKL